MPTIELTTRDGERVTFAAEPTETLLDAAARANIFLPAVCREGGCGSCRVTRQTGEVEHGPYSKAALSDAERAAGEILLCRTQARSDLELKAPFDRAAIGFMPIPERNAAIAELSSAGSSAVRLVLRLADDPMWGRAAEFIPGQFVELALPGTLIRRAYSLANTPNWDGTLEFLIRLQPNGAFSSYFADRAKIGDMLVVRGPQGSFTVDEASQAPRWFVAGGTGLAPMLAILRQMAEFGDPRDCRLFFGVNREEELFAAEEIETLKTALPQLKVALCVWKPEPGWTGFSGTPTDALASALAGLGTLPDLYVCGPPALIEAAEAVALKAGIAHDRVFSEQFLRA
ncbi:2Fe-2S iron-sulfur cluster-binding protein [Methylocapsa aurea]|uniref:2Fe-2S iron-sulfur cluster-binding protein n=1 Tax=Methylocapsa aurea TaxID=663610 RepID=UPI0005658F94|nr:2Fe-2S iron-sulfur cluster binding domain-containing protein [Methylocapsa aurea]